MSKLVRGACEGIMGANYRVGVWQRKAAMWKAGIDASSDFEARTELNVTCELCEAVLERIQSPESNGIDIEQEGWEDWIEHHGTLEELLASAADGCHVCTLLARSSSTSDGETKTDAMKRFADFMLVQNYVDVKAEGIWASSPTRRLRWTPSGKVCVCENGLPVEDGEVVLLLTIPGLNGATSDPARQASVPLNYASKVLGPPVVPAFHHTATQARYTGAESVLTLAKEWLNECSTKHDDICRRPLRWSDPSFKPSRLIEVGTKGIRLVIAAEVPPSPSYLALSYSWGDDEVLKLTKASLDTMRKAIDTEKLPATFTHAVKIARYLKVPYLWIDALCILQGDSADWEHESKLMAQVYGNAICTISSASAASVSGGSFSWRNPLSYLPCRASGFRTLGTHLCHSLTPCDLIQTRVQTVEYTKINSRAWCFQERLLSKRVLHFTKQGIFWECCSREASDVNFKGRKLRSDSRDIHSSLRTPMALLNFEEIPNPSFTAIGRLLGPTGETWNRRLASKCAFSIEHHHDQHLSHRLVRQYTARDLSHKADRLTGFTGVLRAFESATSLRQSYGIWVCEGDPRPGSPSSVTRQNVESLEIPFSEICCLRDLLWRCEVDDDKGYHLRERPKDDRKVPSWSWAAVDGVVTWTTREKEQYGNELDNRGVGLKLNAGNGSGLFSAKLVKKTLWRTSKSRIIRQIPFDGQEKFAFEIEGPLLTTTGGECGLSSWFHHPQDIHDPENPEEKIQFQWFWPDTRSSERMVATDEVAFLPFLWIDAANDEGTPGPKLCGVRGLVLTHVSHSAYQRLGLFQFGMGSGESAEMYSECQRWQERFLEAPQMTIVLI